MKVTFFQRKPRASGNFSLEFIFDDVRERLDGKIKHVKVVAPYLSNGFFRRVGICFHAWRRQSDVNHVTGDTNFTAISLRRERTLLTILDCGSLSGLSGWKKWIMKKVWFDWPIASSNIVTTISNSVKREILEHTNCDPQKIRVVPVAVSEKFKRTDRDFSNVPRIMHLGTAPNKNLPRLIEALKGIPCTLVVVGKLNEETRRLAEQHSIDIENHFNLPWDDVIQLYVDCDIVAFVSTYEGFGMPIVEANVVGRVVVTGNVSSMPEVAGNSACLVDPFDADSIRTGILRVIEDSGYRESLIANGFENARRFHGDAIAKMYLEIYEEIANKSQTKRMNHANKVPS